ncbi:MAG: type II toxin-antitoxin system Phd/YefM family antitoxin [Sporichthyaceae bacterium]
MTAEAFETLAEVKAHLSRYVDAAEQHHRRTTITRRGKPAAVLVAVADLESLEETIAVLADSAAVRDLAATESEWARGAYTSAAEMDELMAARRRAESG